VSEEVRRNQDDELVKRLVHIGKGGTRTVILTTINGASNAQSDERKTSRNGAGEKSK